MKGPDIYLLSGSSYCHGEKEAFLARPHHVIFFSIATISVDSAKFCFLYTS